MCVCENSTALSRLLQFLGVFFLPKAGMSNGTFLNRRFGYVDFASEEDMQKAMELNGKKFMGQELKLDMPRSKDASQDGKKGERRF